MKRIPTISLTPDKVIELLQNEKELKYKTANYIAEPFMASLWSGSDEGWDFVGSSKEAGKDAIFQGRVFEFKIDSGLRAGQPSPNLFIETGKKVSKQYRYPGSLSHFFFEQNEFVNSGINAVQGENSIYGIWHGQAKTAFFFNVDKLRKCISSMQPIAVGDYERTGVLIQAFFEDGSINPRVADICEKIVIVSEDGSYSEWAAMEKPVVQVIRNPVKSGLDTNTPNVALDRETFTQAMRERCDIELECYKLNKVIRIPFEKMKEVKPVFFPKHVLLPRSVLP